jgi:hypothetical protein
LNEKTLNLAIKVENWNRGGEIRSKKFAQPLTNTVQRYVRILCFVFLPFFFFIHAMESELSWTLNWHSLISNQVKYSFRWLQSRRRSLNSHIFRIFAHLERFSLRYHGLKSKIIRIPPLLLSLFWWCKILKL